MRNIMHFTDVGNELKFFIKNHAKARYNGKE
jgi:hypothetical protein